MPIPSKLADLLADFETITDRTERTEMLIYYADQFVEVPAEIAERPFPEEKRVPYCESEAYVWSEAGEGDSLDLHFAVENPQGISAKAMAAILKLTVSGASAAEIAELNPEIVYTLFGKEISMGKGQGLTGMVSVVKHIAEHHMAD